MIRHCSSPHCDVKSKHDMDISHDGKSVWKCSNCGKETPRLNRKSKKQKEFDKTMDSLNEEFENFLNEESDFPAGGSKPSVGPSGNVVSADDVDINPAELKNDEMLSRINGFLSFVSNKAYMNPYSAILEVKTKLGFIGLTFPDVYLSGESGTVTKKLKQYGGRKGIDETGKILDDDGISHTIPEGLSLKITWLRTKGMYTLEIQIVKG